MRISDWSSDVCSSDLLGAGLAHRSGDADHLALHPRARGPAKRLQRRRAVRHQHMGLGDGLADDRARRALAERLVDEEIGRPSCRERMCQYVSISVVAVSLKKPLMINLLASLYNTV